MSRRRTVRGISVALGAAACITASLFAFASGTYSPPLPPRTNKSLLTGEKLWKSKHIIGPGGRTCEGCHDRRRGTPLDGDSLAGKRDDLDKLVYFCVVTRGRNSLAQPSGPEIRALRAYLDDRFELGRPRVQAPDDPRGTLGIARARNLYLQGQYDQAIGDLNRVLRLAISPQLEAEAHLLLGSTFHILGDSGEARWHFSRVFLLFPTARIDSEIFSPSTVELFETVRDEEVRTSSNDPELVL